MKYMTANETSRKISGEKQDKIIEAALNEFAQYGYSGANINKIAERAGVSVGSLYKYFNDKQNLYNEMTTENNSELTWKTAGSVEGVTADLYASLIEKAQKAGAAGKGFDPRYFAFFMDNLFVMLQFSYSCEYYKERLKMYVGESAIRDDLLMREQLMKFIKGAFQ